MLTERRPEDAVRLMRAVVHRRPDLRELPRRLIHTGWDSAVLEIDGRWIARFPRHGDAATALLREREVLLAAEEVLSPVRVPRFLEAWLDDGDEATPGFALYECIPGRAPAVPADDCERVARAKDLGGVIGRIQQIPLVAVGAPEDRDDCWHQWIDDCEDTFALIEREVFPLLSAATRQRLSRHAASLLTLLHRCAPSPVVVHGDLRRDNLLVGDDQVITAVLDWSDAEMGDPAFEFRTVAVELGEGAAASALAIARADSAHLWPRVQHYAALLPLEYLLFAMEREDTVLTEQILASLA